MRGFAIVIQLLLTLVVVASVMPIVLTVVPQTQNRLIGPGVALALAIAIFAGLRALWPARKSE
jgi:hypothetical protein